MNALSHICPEVYFQFLSASLMDWLLPDSAFPATFLPPSDHLFVLEVGVKY